MNSSQNFLRTIGLPILAVIAIYFGVRTAHTQWDLRQAEHEVEAGRGALASERLEPIRDRVTTDNRGCSVYLKSNSLAHRMDRLQWGAESCASRSVDIPEVAVAEATAREAGGDSQGALAVLLEAAPRYKGSPMVYLKLFTIMKAAKNTPGARFALLKAVDEAPSDAKVIWVALQQFVAQSDWADAKQMADRIKNLPDADRPEVKFLAARAMLRGGDSAGAGALAEQGKSLIATKPELQERFAKEFSEFFPGAANAGPQSQVATTAPEAATKSSDPRKPAHVTAPPPQVVHAGREAPANH